VLNYLKHVNTATLQIGAVNAQPAVFLTVIKNSGTGSNVVNGDVYFKGSATFTAADVVEFIAFGELS
jgi:hypothetical protein